ncbi:MAG: glutamate--tRNA ligase [Clostridia bacterium]|nr:glutamate--tRNA ligase [Clostridia bacterium]
MDYKELADLIFPNAKDISYYEEKYPERNLEEGAVVTRYAPSPTGFLHIGSLFQVLIASLMARKTNGVNFLRIEDTDQKREIEGATDAVIAGLKDFGIHFDEGMISNEEGKGEYGPYKQSQRKEIYESYAKYLLAQGKAYPCFASQEELEEMRKKQESAKIRTGYYGVWAKYRNLSVEDAAEKIKNGEQFVIRLKSPGNEEKKIKHKDAIKGNVEFPENDQDIIIIKGDGLPTYHFAHAIDDHLMHTTLVVRGEEWFSSVPTHLQLFYVLGFKPPKYAHIPTIMKMDGESKRKLSKRKDPEANVAYYSEEGIPKESVLEYLLNIANSNFEIWRKQNPNISMNEFDFQLNKMGVSGALFDMVKMLDVSKNVISRMNAQEVYENALNWANGYDKELAKMLQDKEYGLKVLGIERGNSKPRKDISKWSELKDNISYMYNEKFDQITEFSYGKISDESEISKIVKLYEEKYFDINDDKQTWFDKMKDLAEELGYAREVKMFKSEPEKWPGHVGDISTVIRVKLTGRQNTPDLYEIINVLGSQEVKRRLQK